MRLPVPPAPPAPQAPSPPHTTQSCRNQVRPLNGKLDLNPPHLSEVPPRLHPPPLMACPPGRRLPAVTATVYPPEATGQPKRGCCPRLTQGSHVQKMKDPPPPRGAGCHCLLQDLAQPHVVARMLKLHLTGTTCCPPHGTGLRSAHTQAHIQYVEMYSHISIDDGNCFVQANLPKQQSIISTYNSHYSANL